jgi:hypothetical protein
VVPDGVSSVTLHVYGGASETVPVHSNLYIAAVHATGGYLPVYEDLGESPPPASAPPTFWVTFGTPTGPVSALIGGIAGQARSTSSTTTTDCYRPSGGLEHPMRLTVRQRTGAG